MLISPLYLVSMNKTQKNFEGENEAKRANQLANKRIIYLSPFWNKVYNMSAKINQMKLCVVPSQK